MIGLHFEVVDISPDLYAVVPTLNFRLRVTETAGAQVQAVALRCQLRVEPQRRQYTGVEEGALRDQFGPPSQWGESLHPFLWTHTSTVVGSFAGAHEFDLPVACSYDLEVAATSYFEALQAGDIPVVLLFSGTVFAKGDTGLLAMPVPWDCEASSRLPVATWRAMIDHYFPNAGWVRLDRRVIDGLRRFKSDRALPTWDQAVEALLKQSGEEL